MRRSARAVCEVVATANDGRRLWLSYTPWKHSTSASYGHKRQSLTYGHYSQGERLRKELRGYINRLRYSDEVTRLIRGRKRPVAAVQSRRVRRVQ
jgi:hypothetical protein